MHGSPVIPRRDLAGCHVEVQWELDLVRLVEVQPLELHQEVLVKVRQGLGGE